MPATTLPRTVFNAREGDKRKLLPDEAEALAHLVLAFHGGPKAPFHGSDAPVQLKQYCSPEQVPGYAAILAGRLALAPDCLFDVDTVMMCAALCDRPAVAVLWAYALVQHARACQRAMTIDEWCVLMGDGVPTEEFYHKCWREQQGFNGASGNWLDQHKAWSVN